MSVTMGQDQLNQIIARAMYDYLKALHRAGAVDDSLMSLHAYYPLSECLERWRDIEAWWRAPEEQKPDSDSKGAAQTKRRPAIKPSAKLTGSSQTERR